MKKNARTHLVNRLFRPTLFIGLNCSFKLSNLTNLSSKSLHIHFYFILFVILTISTLIENDEFRLGVYKCSRKSTENS